MNHFTKRVYLSAMLLLLASIGVFAQQQAFFDDFESGDLTQAGWTQETTNAPTLWSVGNSGVGSVTPYGNYMAKLYSATYQDPVKLVTPMLDINDLVEPYLSFYMASEKYNIGQRDTLKIYYKEPGGEWTIIRAYNQNTDNWQKMMLRLKDYTQATNFQLAFEYCFANGKGIALDSISLFAESVCFNPINLTAQNITNTSAVLRWIASSYCTMNYIKVSSTPIPANLIEQTTADVYNGQSYISFIPLNNLTENTQYYWYVKSECGGTDISSWSSGIFRTRCNPIPAANVSSVVEGFETSPTNGYPNCWIRTRQLSGDWVNVNVSQNDYMPAVDNSVAKNGSKSLRISGYYLNNEALSEPRYAKSYAITQGYDVVNMNQYQVEFWARTTEQRNMLHVGVMTNPDDINTFESIETIKLNNEDSWQKVTVYFVNNANNGKYVAFMADGADNNHDNIFYIDDVVLKQIPACPSPISFRFINTVAQGTTYGARFDWRSLYPNHNFEIALFTDPNADPNTMFPDIQANNLQSPATVQGLASYTTYYAFIRNSCGSPWSDHPIVFTTPLLPVSLPDVETFENNNPWIIKNGNQINKWIISTAEAYAGNKSLFITKDNGLSNSYNYTNSSKVYALKKYKFLANQDVEVSFYWKNKGGYDEENTSSDAYLQAFIVPDNSPDQPAAGSLPFENWIKASEPLARNNSWTQSVHNVKAATAGSYSLIFSWINGSGGTSDNNPPAAVDNIVVRPLTCSTVSNLKVTNITHNSAQVSWEPGLIGGSTEWLLWCRPFSSPDTTGIAPIVVNNSSYNLTNLNALTKYRVYVVSKCGTSNRSYAKTVDFTARQIANALPFRDNFNTSANWRLENGSQINKWVIGTADNNGSGSNKSLYISNNGGANRRYTKDNAVSYVYAYSTFEFANNEAYSLSFDYKSFGERETDILNLFLVPDNIHEPLTGGIDNGMAGVLNDPPLNWIPLSADPLYNSVNSGAWKTYNTTFAVPNTGRYKLVFFWKNNASSGNPSGAAGIDNVSIEMLECSAPYNIDVEIDADTMRISWLASSNAISWDISVGLDTNNMPPPTNVTNPSYNYVNNNFLAERTYYIKITSNCQGGDTNTKIHKYNMTTQFPFYTSFEPTDDNASWKLSVNSGNNSWVMGSDANASSDGANGLYVSSKHQTTKEYEYDTSSPSVTYAYRVFDMKRGVRYVLDFDWKSGGESSYDYLRVFMVPISDKQALETASQNGVSAYSTPTGWVDLAGGQMNLSPSWSTKNIDYSSNIEGMYYLAFYWRNDGYRGTQPPAAIDNIAFYPIYCEMVEGLEVSNVSKNGALITWNGVEGATYDLKISTTSINPQNQDGDVLNEMNYNDTLINLQGLLSAGTTYFVYVRVTCDDGYKSYYKKLIFGTLCDPINLPYNQDFEAYNLGLFPNCWSSIVQQGDFEGNYAPHIAEEVDGASMGNRYLKFTSNYIDTVGSTKAFAVLPEFNTPINQIQVKFKVIGAPDKQVVLAVSPSNTDPSMASIIPGTFIASPTGAEYTAVLDGAPAGSKYITFIARGDENLVGIVGIDDIMVSTFDQCLPPNDINQRNITNTSVEIFWDSPYMGVKTWHVVVTTVDIGNDMSQLATLPANQVIYNQNVTGNQVVVSGLTPATKYYYYVRKVCGNGYSPWFDDSRYFRTICLAAQECDVEFILQNTNSNGWGGNINKVEVILEDDVEHTLRFTVPNSGLFARKDTLKLCPNTYKFVFTKDEPAIDLSFKVVLNGDTVISTSSNNSTMEVFTIDISQNCQAITCNNISNIAVQTTANTAGLSWDGNGDSYEVRVFTGDVSLVDMMLSNPLQTQTVATENVQINSLVANTTYSVFIKSNCTSNNLESGWIKVMVRTSVDFPPETLPINTDFDNPSDNANWMYFSTGVNKWKLGNVVNYGPGENGLYISGDNGASNVYTSDISFAYATRFVHLDGGKDYHLTFNWRSEGDDEADLLRAFLIPGSYAEVTNGHHFGMSGFNNNAPEDWIEISNGILAEGGSTIWHTSDTIVSLSVTGNYFLAFIWKNNAYQSHQPPAAIDNVSFYEEVCPQPNQLRVHSITPTSAVVDWIGTVPTSYDVKLYKYSTFVNPDTDPSLQDVAGNTNTDYSFAGLTPNTRYLAFVKSNCGSDASAWKSVEFITDFTLSTLPINSNFETAEANQWVIRSSNPVGVGNGWTIGNAVKKSGSSSLYVSKNGTSYNYNLYKESYSYAFRAINLSSLEGYNFSFSWKGEGQVNNDLARIFLIPVSYKQSILDAEHLGMNNTNNDPPTDWIDLGGNVSGSNNLLQGSNSWSSVNKYVTVPTNGVYYLAFFWKNNPYGGSQPPVAVDDVIFEKVPCPRPLNITVTTTGSTATIEWLGVANSYNVKLYDLSTSSTSPISDQIVNANTVTFPGLTQLNEYKVSVAAQCDDGALSDVIDYNFIVINTVDSLPLNANMESEVDNSMWKFASNGGINRWVIGTAAKKSGNKGLYISYVTSGSTNSYDIRSTSYSVAYRKVPLKATDKYAYSFDWKAGGESTYDYMRAFVVPGSVDIETDFTKNITFSEVPTGCIDLNTEGGGMNLSSGSWKHVDSVGFRVPSDGFYYLAFYWKNDQSAGTQAGAAVDNFVFSAIGNDTVRATVCLGYPYQGNNFDIEAEEISGLGLHKFYQLYTDPNTGEIKNLYLFLTAIPGEMNIVNRTICEGDTLHFYGRIIRATTSQKYQHYAVASNGCDSIIELDLKVNAKSITDKDTTLNNCDDLPGTVNGQYFDEHYPVGTWIVTRELSTVDGCDSIINYIVTVEGPCNSIDIIDLKNVKFIPNPINVGETLTITGEFTEQELNGLRVDVITSTGAVIYSDEPGHYPIKLDAFPQRGLYIIRVVTGKGDIFYGKIIVK